MKNQILPATVLTFCCIVLFCGAYTLVVWGIAQASPGRGRGEIISYNKETAYGFSNVGQSFTDDLYFYSRPSAVNYNAAGSAGSNKGPSNPEYLAQVESRIDTFLIHNPGIAKSQIPTELMTASGSGLDPDISPAAANVQIKRIARLRKLEETQLSKLVKQHTEPALIGLLGPPRVNVLRLNIALDELKH